jgi:hypothetical protein
MYYGTCIRFVSALNHKSLVGVLDIINVSALVSALTKNLG